MSKVAFKHSELSAIRRWPTLKAKLWVEDYLWRVKDDQKVLAVIAVGSSVRDGVPSKDLDLVTIIKGDPDDGLQRPPIEVDLRVFSSEGLQEKILGGNDYLGWAVKFGKAVYEREGYWTNVVASLGSRIPFPSSAIARERSKVALKHASRLLGVGDEDAAWEQITSALTHLGRAALIDSGVYPASRPELPAQLEKIGKKAEGALLRKAISETCPSKILLEEIRGIFPV